MPTDTGGGAGSTDYILVGVADDFRVNPSNNTFTPVVNVTAQSVVYGVQYTWTILQKTWLGGNQAAILSAKAAEVDAIMEEPHVVDFRTESNQGPSQVIYNYAVITVGTADRTITSEVTARMDQLTAPSVQTNILAAWAALVAAGAPATG